MAATETQPLRRTLVEPLRDEAQFQALLQAAAADDHVVIAPSHVATQDGQVVGYASLGSIAVVNVWLDSKRVKALDSLRLLKQAESVAKAMGLRQYLMPCAHTSPFLPHMERLGFTKLGYTCLHWKAT